jgi:hypothetical protein
MNTPLLEAEEKLEREEQIPEAFIRAFTPTPVDLVAAAFRSIRGWFRRQSDARWLPRQTDPLTELKHVWFDEFGSVPSELKRPSRRRIGDSLY